MAPAHTRFSYQELPDDNTDTEHEAVELGPFDGTEGGSLTYTAVPTIEPADLPEEPVSTEETPAHRTSIMRIFSGWRGGAISAAGLSLISLCINLGVGIWLSTKPNNPGGLTEVFNGNCNTAKQLTTWIHLAINILSTLLLGGSNYCMQCLSAPTREEVDKAHAKGTYLDIGVPNLRNLRAIAVHKQLMWWILGLTSIPLHLVYNSAFYSSLSNNDYNILIVTPDFVTGGAFDLAAAINASATLTYPVYDATIPRIYDSKPSSTTACDAYVSEIEAASDEWEPWGYQVQYCISETVDESCSLNGNILIIITVIACNAVKAALMLFVAFRLHGSPLITIGDAVASFLQRPDLTTEGLCLLTRQDVTRENEKIRLGRKSVLEQPRLWPLNLGATTPRGQPATNHRYRWCQAASWWRWILTIGLMVLALAIVATLLAWGAQRIDSKNVITTSMWKLGFGAININTLITGWDIERIANLPQTILSFLYLNLNGLLTSMFLADEWSDFCRERKALRVSTPQGRQRSTYFLELPYRIGIPLMVLSGLLHWLVSQSIFLAVISAYSPRGDLANPVAVASCGYSPIAMLTVLLLGALIVVGVIGLSFQRYDGGIPLVGSCSVAISAACHRPAWDTDAHLNPVQWGAVPGQEQETELGHCCFTSGKVEEPVVGKMYAGIPPKLD
ncbi:hypothetical protein DV738_g2021, partial [Chaetothyriales sp. CBS 135597]